jgi:integrase
MRTFKTTWTDKKGNKISTKKWYIEFRDHLKIIRRLTAFTDESLSEVLGRKIVKLVNYKIAGENLDPQLSRWLEQIPTRLRNRFVEIGLIDNTRASAGKLLDEHLEDFKQSLLAKGNTFGYVDTVIARAGRIIDRCKFRIWTDISASEVELCLMDMRDGTEDISAQTFNFYLQAIKQFCRWMVQNRRASESPLKHLQKIRVLSTDKRHDRRALEPDEIRRLLETTIAAPKRFSMTGYERYLVYRLACETGLRAKELKKLTVSSFDFENLTVTVIDAYSKNRKQSILPLRKDTAAELHTHFVNKTPSVKAFKVPYKTANMLKADLADAGISYVDDSGRYADFHSLRHSTGSLLAASGVHPKVIQSIMRHSDINLTMSRYAHIFHGQESEAVAKLPDLGSPSKEGHKTAATGTNGKSDLAPNLAPKGGKP